MYYAVAYGNLETCKLLKSHGSYHDYIDENGETPLYYAIKSNHDFIVEWLINKGCNLQIANN